MPQETYLNSWQLVGKGHRQEHQQNWHPYIHEDKVTVERYNCREVWLTLNSPLDHLTLLGSYRSQSPHMHWTEHNLLSKVWRNQLWARQVHSFSGQWQKWTWGGGRRGEKRGISSSDSQPVGRDPTILSQGPQIRPPAYQIFITVAKVTKSNEIILWLVGSP